ncbi:hypothetical protein [Bacillus phage vB_BceS-M2]
MANVKIEEAKATLVHYLQTAFEGAGLLWNEDNVDEVHGLVDNLVEGIKEEVK